MGSPVVQSLFVTLKRSLASTRDTHVRILKSLGLQRRQQTVERKNAPAVRGALQKVQHMVTVETDAAHAARLQAEAAARAPKPPITVTH